MVVLLAVRPEATIASCVIGDQENAVVLRFTLFPGEQFQSRVWNFGRYVIYRTLRACEHNGCIRLMTARLKSDNAAPFAS
jgi:hypothetical protein